MSNARNALWARLHQAGLVEDAQAPASVHTPWFIHGLLGICAWFAAFFLMGFFGLLLHDLFDNAAGLIVIGAGCCAGALWMLRAARGALFLSQFALPFSLAGQGMLAVGFAQVGSRFDVLAFGIGLQLVGLAMVMLASQPAHRFLSMAMALTGLAVMLVEQEALALAPPVFAAAALVFWLFARESMPLAQYAAWRPAMHAMNLGLLAAVWFVGQPLGFELMPGSAWLMQVSWLNGPLLALLWLACVWGLLRGRGIAPGSPASLPWLGAGVLLALLLWPAPGVLATLMLMLLGFAASERTVLVMGAIGLLVYLARYYYQLDVDLMAKSGVLVASGLILIGLRLLPRWLRSPA